MSKIYEQYKQPLIEYASKKGFAINLDNPITIQDKINWMKLYDSTEIKTFCADKILLHDYCKKIYGKDICIPILKIYNNVEEINFDELPDKFVIKCNHGAAMNLICKDKGTFNIANAKQRLNKWINRNFAFAAGYEMHYSAINRKIYVEKYMGEISDYKFWCFNGEPKFYTITESNNGAAASYINYYNMDQTLSNINNLAHPMNPAVKQKQPEKFNEMINIVKIFAKNFNFVRIDLYEINKQIYLGELTFTPGSGFMKYVDDQNEIIGDMLDLTNNKEFSKIMNKYANNFGMNHTSFYDPTGLGINKIYSTTSAFDSCLLLKQCYKCNNFISNFFKDEYKIKITNDNITKTIEIHNTFNKNKLKDYNILFGKTGFGDSNESLVCIANINNHIIAFATFSYDSHDNAYKSLNELLNIALNILEQKEYKESSLSKGCCIYDITDDKVLYSYNEYKLFCAMPITKIMTTLICYNMLNNKLNNTYSITYQDLLYTKNTAGDIFKANDNITINDLIYSSLLLSSNQAANAIATIVLNNQK